MERRKIDVALGVHVRSPSDQPCRKGGPVPVHCPMKRRFTIAASVIEGQPMSETFFERFHISAPYGLPSFLPQRFQLPPPRPGGGAGGQEEEREQKGKKTPERRDRSRGPWPGLQKCGAPSRQWS